MPKKQGFFRTLGESLLVTVEKVTNIEYDIPTQVEKVKNDIAELYETYNGDFDGCALHIAILYQNNYYHDYERDAIENEMVALKLDLDKALEEYSKTDWSYVADSALKTSVTIGKGFVEHTKKEYGKEQDKKLKSEMSRQEYGEYIREKLQFKLDQESADKEERQEINREIYIDIKGIERLYYIESGNDDSKNFKNRYSNYVKRLITTGKGDLNKLSKIVNNEYLKETISLVIKLNNPKEEEYKKFEDLYYKSI